MTEPTAEQVAMDRERARAQRVLDESKGWCGCNSCVEIIAVALRDRAIEAHAAGRDEGLRDAEEAATRQCCDCRNESGVHGEWCHGHLCGGAIRALRART